MAAKKPKKKSEIQELSEFIRDHMATKSDIAELKNQLTGEFNGKITGVQAGLMRLSDQVNSIERDIREMKGVKLEFRVADLEEKVFGKSRG